MVAAVSQVWVCQWWKWIPASANEHAASTWEKQITVLVRTGDTENSLLQEDGEESSIAGIPFITISSSLITQNQTFNIIGLAEVILKLPLVDY